MKREKRKVQNLYTMLSLSQEKVSRTDILIKTLKLLRRSNQHYLISGSLNLCIYLFLESERVCLNVWLYLNEIVPFRRVVFWHE